MEQGSRSRLKKRGAFSEGKAPKANERGSAAAGYALIEVDAVSDVLVFLGKTGLFMAERRVRELDGKLPSGPLMPLYGALAGVIPDVWCACSTFRPPYSRRQR